MKRAFVASCPDQLWVADMTYLHTRAGFLYLAVVEDGYSRRVVGWASAKRMTAAESVIVALAMAVTLRKPREVIHHSDQGHPVHQPGLWPALWTHGGMSLPSPENPVHVHETV